MARRRRRNPGSARRRAAATSTTTRPRRRGGRGRGSRRAAGRRPRAREPAAAAREDGATEKARLVEQLRSAKATLAELGVSAPAAGAPSTLARDVLMTQTTAGRRRLELMTEREKRRWDASHRVAPPKAKATRDEVEFERVEADLVLLMRFPVGRTDASTVGGQFTRLLADAARVGQWRTALKVYRAAAQRRIEPSLNTFTILITACRRGETAGVRGRARRARRGARARRPSRRGRFAL